VWEERATRLWLIENFAVGSTHIKRQKYGNTTADLYTAGKGTPVTAATSAAQYAAQLIAHSDWATLLSQSTLGGEANRV
jgi:hypothetical protein